MDNNLIWQAVMFFGAGSGCLGMGMLLGGILGLPIWLAGSVAILFGAVYGWIMAEVVTSLPGLRERWEVTPSYQPGLSDRPGCMDVLAPYLVISILAAISFPVFQQAREKARAARGLPPRAATSAWVVPTAVALPLGFAGLVALVGRRLRASRRLYHMAMEGDTEGVRRLLDQGADPNAEDPLVGRSPLIWAITGESADPRSRLAVAGLLLRRGGDPNLGDRDGRPPLLRAIAERHPDIISLLLSHGADPNRPEPSSWGGHTDLGKRRRTPLMEAAPFPAMIQPLLDAGADVSARDVEGATALTYAARGSNWTDWTPAMSAESIRLLVAHGAEVDARDHRGRTALFACANAAEIVSALLQAGADVHARDAAGMTPLIAVAGHAAIWVARMRPPRG